MTDQDQIRAIAELDGIGERHMLEKQWSEGTVKFHSSIPPYLTSRDAIVSTILNLKSLDRARFVNLLLQVLKIRDDQSPEPSEMFDFATATPDQLCEALLRTSSKWNPSSQNPARNGSSASEGS